jgi:putative tryptophan/tyrosine transport system substrate-binding protein
MSRAAERPHRLGVSGVATDQLNRRRFLILLGGAALVSAPLWPLAGRAQQAGGTRRIGMLMGMAESDPLGRSYIGAFQQGLRELGWAEGRNLTIDVRWGAADPTRIGVLARELVGLRPDLLIGAQSSVGVAALSRETRTIPIVFIVASDPIGSGFVEGYAHPGGNVTGFTNFESSVASKWPQLLKEIAPATTRANILFNPETAVYADYFARPFLAAGPTLGLALGTAPVRDDSGIEAAIAALAKEPGGGLIVMPDPFTTSHRATIIALATRHRLPVIYPDRFYVAEGGLISYGVDFVDIYRRATVYADRILRGEKPADLPVQAPVKFQFVINLKVANALGLTIPQALLASADEVIE